VGAGVGDGVGDGVGAGLGDAVGTGVGLGVGDGVGMVVGDGVGDGVGLGVGAAVSSSVMLTATFTTGNICQRAQGAAASLLACAQNLPAVASWSPKPASVFVATSVISAKCSGLRSMTASLYAVTATSCGTVRSAGANASVAGETVTPVCVWHVSPGLQSRSLLQN
jgi:hypothetical protein